MCCAETALKIFAQTTVVFAAIPVAVHSYIPDFQKIHHLLSRMQTNGSLLEERRRNMANVRL